MDRDKKIIGVIMSGGGARAAYQVGVLKAIAEILPERVPNPFPVICGASAGAINAAALAVYADNFQNAVRRLERVWGNFHVGQVFRTDVRGMVANWGRWWASFLRGSSGAQYPMSMFDRSPLRTLLDRYLPCERIHKAIVEGHLRALSITVSGYSTGQSVSFFQGLPELASWQRATQVGAPALLTVDHLMASSAIPVVFEAVRINREYFGDGSMRQMAPISPALHLGADKVLVIGVRQERSSPSERHGETAEYPTLAQISGHVLSSIFLDSLEADLDRLRRANETARLVAGNPHMAHLKHVEALLISPSKDLGAIATRHRQHFPRSVRLLLRGLGAGRRSGGDLLSYLLFEKPYTRELIDLGHHDAMQRRVEIEAFFRDS